MRRLHWPRFAVFLMVLATFATMAAANSYACIADATAPQTDEQFSAMTPLWFSADNDGTIATTAIIDVENVDDAYIAVGATAILTTKAAITTTTLCESVGVGISTVAIGGTDQTSSPAGMRDAGGIYFAAVTSDGTRYDAKKMAQVAEFIKTANTNGVIRV
ncbi:MAG: hypothetical protein WCT33_03500 [Patescibacteria group bacterium]